jgi:hypothetical protein
MDYMGDEVGRTTDATEAASLAASHLPTDLSPLFDGGEDRPSRR